MRDRFELYEDWNELFKLREDDIVIASVSDGVDGSLRRFNSFFVACSSQFCDSTSTSSIFIFMFDFIEFCVFEREKKYKFSIIDD